MQSWRRARGAARSTTVCWPGPRGPTRGRPFPLLPLRHAARPPTSPPTDLPPKTRVQDIPHANQDIPYANQDIPHALLTSPHRGPGQPPHLPDAPLVRTRTAGKPSRRFGFPKKRTPTKKRRNARGGPADEKAPAILRWASTRQGHMTKTASTAKRSPKETKRTTNERAISDGCGSIAAREIDVLSGG